MRERVTTPAPARSRVILKGIIWWYGLGSDLDPGLLNTITCMKTSKNLLTSFGDDLKPVRRAAILKNIAKMQQVV